MPNGIIDRYDLEYRVLEDTLFAREFPTGNAQNFTIIDLTPNTTYVFRLAAVTVVGRGPYSMEIINSTRSKFTIHILWHIKLLITCYAVTSFTALNSLLL